MEAQGQTEVQCKQNENLEQQNSSEAVSTQIAYAPVRLEAQGQKQQFQRRQGDSSQQQNSSRAVSNQIGHAPVRLEAATTESREARVSHVTFSTTHRDSEQPSVSRTSSSGKSAISQQQNGGGVVSTQIGHTPVRLEAQGQTVVQCRKNEISQQQKNSSRAILTQIGHEPGRLELRARHQFSTDKTRTCSSGTVSAGRAILRSSKTVAGQCQIRSGMHPFRLEVATTESREVRVSDTSHLTRPIEIRNIQALAKPAADRAVPCRESEISQQQNGGGVVSTQIGHAPVRLEAQGQTTVQCRQNKISQQQKNSSRAVLTQIGHEPGRLEAQGQTAVQCKQNENLQQQNCSGAVSIQTGHAPVRLEAQGQTQHFSAGRAILRSSRTVAGQCQIRSGMHPFGWKPLQPSLGRSEYRTRHILHDPQRFRTAYG